MPSNLVKANLTLMYQELGIKDNGSTVPAMKSRVKFAIHAMGENVPYHLYDPGSEFLPCWSYLDDQGKPKMGLQAYHDGDIIRIIESAGERRSNTRASGAQPMEDIIMRTADLTATILERLSTVEKGYGIQTTHHARATNLIAVHANKIATLEVNNAEVITKIKEIEKREQERLDNEAAKNVENDQMFMKASQAQTIFTTMIEENKAVMCKFPEMDRNYEAILETRHDPKKPTR
jgi:hypothetical protein